MSWRDRDAVQILTNTRQASILQAFLDALTRGGPDGFPRPIELHAHDPTRYIGDMLAWIHQATAGENEFLDNLFDVEKGRGRMVGQTRNFSASPADTNGDVDPAKALQAAREETSRACLDKNLEGLSRPLKVSKSFPHTFHFLTGTCGEFRCVYKIRSSHRKG